MHFVVPYREKGPDIKGSGSKDTKPLDPVTCIPGAIQCPKASHITVRILRSFFGSCHLYIGSFLLLCSLAHSQNVVDLLRSHGALGDRAYSRGDYQQAMVHYRLRASRDNSDAWSKAQLARINYRLGNKEEALEWYMNVRDTSLLNDTDFLQIGDALHATGKSAEAEKWFKAFQSQKPHDSRSHRKLLSVSDKEKIFRDSLSYVISNVAFNTEHSEYAPAIWKGQLLFLSDRTVYRLIKQAPATGEGNFLEMYKVPYKDQKSEPALFSEKLSSRGHEGPYCFMKDGRVLIFTKNDPASHKLHLYVSELKRNEWSEPKALPFNSKNHSLSHPWFNLGDSCLYYASDQEDGFGGTDLYKIRYTASGWDTPLNLGPLINTEGNEMFPFVRGGTLYFASDGHISIGGLDICAVQLDGRGVVRNMGYPINSGSDDFGIYFQNDAQGYFCSNRSGGKGMDDVYEFRNIAQYVSLKVEEKFSRSGIPNVKVTITDIDNTVTELCNGKGEWKSALKPAHSYRLQFFAEGYKDKDTTLLIVEKPLKELAFTIRLERKNKVFIRGFARDEKAHLLENCPIKIVNRQTAEIEHSITNNEGEFVAEVDPDYSYSIVAQNDSLVGFKNAENLPKKRGAFVTVIDVISHPYKELSFEIFVKDNLTGRYLEEAEIEIRNLNTGEVNVLTTDAQGRCTATVHNVSDYSLRSYCNDRESERLILKGKLKESYTLLMK